MQCLGKKLLTLVTLSFCPLWTAMSLLCLKPWPSVSLGWVCLLLCFFYFVHMLGVSEIAFVHLISVTSLKMCNSRGYQSIFCCLWLYKPIFFHADSKCDCCICLEMWWWHFYQGGYCLKRNWSCTPEKALLYGQSQSLASASKKWQMGCYFWGMIVVIFSWTSS